MIERQKKLIFPYCQPQTDHETLKPRAHHVRRALTLETICDAQQGVISEHFRLI